MDETKEPRHGKRVMRWWTEACQAVELPEHDAELLRDVPHTREEGLNHSPYGMPVWIPRSRWLSGASFAELEVATHRDWHRERRGVDDMGRALQKVGDSPAWTLALWVAAVAGECLGFESPRHTLMESWRGEPYRQLWAMAGQARMRFFHPSVTCFLPSLQLPCRFPDGLVERADFPGLLDYCALVRRTVRDEWWVARYREVAAGPCASAAV